MGPMNETYARLGGVLILVDQGVADGFAMDRLNIFGQAFGISGGGPPHSRTLRGGGTMELNFEKLIRAGGG
jgi:hypothetical protein